MKAKWVAIGCLGFVAVVLVISAIESYAAARGFSPHAPHKKFVVIDDLRHPKVRFGGWWWPWKLYEEEWQRNPVPVGTAFEIHQEDAIYAYVTGYSGETRRLMLHFNNRKASLDTTERHLMSLIGYHYSWVPWNPSTNRPACLVPWNAVPFINWPPRSGSFIYFLFVVILGLKVLDCIGKDSFVPMWTLLVYGALLFGAHQGVTAQAESRATCEPQAAAFSQNFMREGKVYPFRSNAIEGAGAPWVADNTPVLTSQVCFYFALILTLRLLYPAFIGAHYLMVPHPAEEQVQRVPGKPLEVDPAGLGRSLGRVDTAKPPSEFVLKNMTRRIRNLADLFRAEREAAEEAIEYKRTRQASEKGRRDE